MKEDKIFESIADIDEKYVVEARTKIAKKNVWVKWASIAACLCLVIVGAVTIFPKHYDTMTGDPIQTGDPIKPGNTVGESINSIPGAAHTENAVTNNEVGDGSYVTAAHMIEIRIKVDIVNSWGFIGTIETGAVSDTCTFPEGEQISVVCEDNVSIVQKDGSVFEFNEVEPNVDESDIEVGDSVWVGFQSYDYKKGNGMYNQVFAYHVDGTKH